MKGNFDCISALASLRRSQTVTCIATSEKRALFESLNIFTFAAFPTRKPCQTVSPSPLRALLTDEQAAKFCDGLPLPSPNPHSPKASMSKSATASEKR